MLQRNVCKVSLCITVLHQIVVVCPQVLPLQACRFIMFSLNIASILGQILTVTAAAQKFYTVREHVAGQEIFQT